MNPVRLYMAMTPLEAEQFGLTGEDITESFVFHVSPGASRAFRRVSVEQASFLSVVYNGGFFSAVPRLRGEPEETLYSPRGRIEGATVDAKVLTATEAVLEYNGRRCQPPTSDAKVIPLHG